MTRASSSEVLSRRDLDFLLYEWLDVETLTTRERFRDHSRSTFDALLEVSQQIAERSFAPHNKTSDQQEPHFDGEQVHLIPEIGAALERFIDAGLIGSTMDYSIGGGQLPNVVSGACLAWFQAANIATFSYPFLTIANANLLLAHGTQEQIDRFVRPMAEGRFFGTMCLSEPQAGSSLAAITTRAESQTDGTYRLFGNKMWISAGEHPLSENIIHLVLARIPGSAAGVKGLSLFIVPKILVEATGELGERNDVVLAGLNHKMGYRGTTNTMLNFGEGKFRPAGEPGAVGYLVGEVDKGLGYMFHMMNEARIGVGIGAAAIGYTAYLKSLSYARTRLQGRALSAGAGPEQAAIIEHPDVKRMLLAQKAYVEGALALNLYCDLLLDEQRTATVQEDRIIAGRLLDILTPIAKSWPAQWCLEANSLAIQIHGGYGYTREYDVEQHYRDNRLNQIHEGTHGIHALDLLGRKVVMHDGACLELLTAKMWETATRADKLGGEAAAFGAELRAGIERISAVTQQLWATDDPEVALANASTYLEATGHVVLSWIWLEQFLAADGKPGEFYDGKRQATRYFFAFELPKTGPMFDLLASLDRTVPDMVPTWY